MHPLRNPGTAFGFGFTPRQKESLLHRPWKTAATLRSLHPNTRSSKLDLSRWSREQCRSLTKETAVRYLYLTTFAAAVLGIYLLTQLGTDYVTIGHGLHPALAVLGSVVFTAVGGFAARAAVRSE